MLQESITPCYSESQIEPRDPGCDVPLTAGQLACWKWIWERGGRTQRGIWSVRRIIGQLNVELLIMCLDFLVGRHEALRTRFSAGGSFPIQLVQATDKCAFHQLDLSGVSLDRQNDELERLAKIFITEDLSPNVGPLFSARLFELSKDKWILLLAFDHMIADRASLAILHGELWDLYQQAERGKRLWLPELRVQFADYAVWQHQRFTVWRSLHENYWKMRLSGLAPTAFPKDGISSSSDRGAQTLIFPFGEELTTQLTQLAKDERTAVHVVVLGVYAIAISRWCKQRDLLILFTAHARYRPETRKMVGLLADALRLRIGLNIEDIASVFLKRVHQEICNAYLHQDFGWSFNLFPEPRSEIWFNWIPSDSLNQALTVNTFESRQLSIEPFNLDIRVPLPMLTFFHHSEAGIVLKIIHQPDLFSSTSVKEFAHDMLFCAKSLVCDTQIRVGLI